MGMSSYVKPNWDAQFRAQLEDNKYLWNGNYSGVDFLGITSDFCSVKPQLYISKEVLLLKVLSGSLDRFKFRGKPVVFSTVKLGCSKILYFCPHFVMALNDFEDPYLLVYGDVFEYKYTVDQMLRLYPIWVIENMEGVTTRSLRKESIGNVGWVECNFSSVFDYEGYHVTVNSKLKDCIHLDLADYCEWISNRVCEDCHLDEYNSRVHIRSIADVQMQMSAQVLKLRKERHRPVRIIE